MTNIYDIKTLTQVFIHENGGEVFETLNGKFGQVGTIVRTKKGYYYLFYKKDWFYKFSYYFPKFKGVGTGTSLKFLKRAALTNSIIVFYIVDKEYQISAKLMNEFVEKNGTIKYFDKDEDQIANIPASFLEKNMISKKRVDKQFEDFIG